MWASGAAPRRPISVMRASCGWGVLLKARVKVCGWRVFGGKVFEVRALEVRVLAVRRRADIVLCGGLGGDARFVVLVDGWMDVVEGD